MAFFGKKKQEEQAIGGAPEEPAPDQKNSQPDSGSANAGQMGADLEKLKAQFSSFYEMQKASSERFTRINEQIGELRAMILEKEKGSQLLEAKATQAIDLVKSIEPDKFMVELRKMDFKIEALKASLESNENVVHNTLNDMKEIRNRMNVFKGIEGVMKLNDEVKNELMEMKKINAVIGRHADKVETFYMEMQKKMRDFNVVDDTVKGLDKSFKMVASDFDGIKVKIGDFVSKKELENLLTRVDNFEKHAGNVLVLLNNKFSSFEKDFNQRYDKKFERTDKLLKGFDLLVQKTPDLDKYFQLLDAEAKKAPADVKVDKIKQPGEEEPMPAPEKKTGLMGKLAGLAKIGGEKKAEGK